MAIWDHSLSNITPSFACLPALFPSLLAPSLELAPSLAQALFIRNRAAVISEKFFWLAPRRVVVSLYTHILIVLSRCSPFPDSSFFSFYMTVCFAVCFSKCKICFIHVVFSVDSSTFFICRSVSGWCNVKRVRINCCVSFVAPINSQWRNLG